MVQAGLADALTKDTTLTGVQVQDGRDDSTMKMESIVIGDVESISTAIAFMVAGRKIRRDWFVFDITFYAAKAGQKKAAAAKARAAQMFAALENFLANDATRFGLQLIQINAYEGPNSYPREGGGWGAVVTAHIECHSEQN